MAIEREIKFRYYDTRDQKLINFNFGNLSGGSVYPDNETVMQFTGRKDKNGIEIYEDDIIIDEEGRYGVIYWNLDDCQFLVDFQADMEIEQISSNYTVCGNSWQNVELLK